MRFRIVLPLLFLLMFLVLPAGESTPVLQAIPVRKLVGEDLSYTLDFLVFRDLAEGRLRITADELPGRYRAELTAKTLGVASWLSGERTQSYESVMEDDGTGRMRSVSHVSIIHKKKNGEWIDRRKLYRFDYQAGKVYQEKGADGVFKPGSVFELPPGETPVDILTGFYNLRAGFYGPLVPGRTLKVPTFTTKGVSAIEVIVLDGTERQSQAFFPAGGTLLRIKVDPEVFETGGGDMYAWLDDAGRPARGIVEDVIGLGDVLGQLREERSSP